MDITVEPASGPPGTSIHYSGHCDLGGVATERVDIMGYRYDPPPGGSVFFSALDHVAPDATFDGILAVPSDAPPGRYVVTSGCFTADVGYGKAETDFTVTDEAPITTTTASSIPSTSVSTSPTTTADGRGPGIEPSPGAPIPLEGSVRYAG